MTDTVTIPADEYAALKKDAERYRWLRREVSIVAVPGFMSGDKDNLVQAARKVAEWDGGTRYDGDDDEVGVRACCFVESYEPHAQDCCIAELHAALKETSHEAE